MSSGKAGGRYPYLEGKTMNKLDINTIALALSLMFSTGAMAEGMTKAEYKDGKDKITEQYKVAKAACKPLSGNAGDVCEVDAKGKEHIAIAELDAAYKPSLKSRYEVQIVKAEADYALAKERCDDKAGNAKDVCVKEAKSVETAAKADAKALLKTSESNTTANEKSMEARKDAKADKTDAQYAVAKEKCDSYSGGAKDRCLDQAKVNFNK
jgi:hypothetical protein